MKKRTIGFIALFATLFFATAHLQAMEASKIAMEKSSSKVKTIGVGLGGGGMASGLTARYYLTNVYSIDLTLGTSGWGNSIGAQYSRNMGKIWSNPNGKLDWEVGAGSSVLSYRFASYSSTILGLNASAGLVWDFNQWPIQLTAAWGPSYLFGDYVGGLHLSSGHGAVRWFF